MTSTAEASVWVAATAEVAWRALTDPQLISEYMWGTRVEGEWRAGGTLWYRGEWEGTPYVDKGIVLELDEPRRLVVDYYSSMSGLPDVPENYQRVTYVVTPEGEGCSISVTQEGNADAAAAETSSANWRAALATMVGVIERLSA